jgi:aerobic-type carbon monoxide dehydrogenase small subunit (CoxS/CutS family)
MTLKVSDREYTLGPDPRESLLDVLRERLGLTGTGAGMPAWHLLKRCIGRQS